MISSRVSVNETISKAPLGFSFIAHVFTMVAPINIPLSKTWLSYTHTHTHARTHTQTQTNLHTKSHCSTTKALEPHFLFSSITFSTTALSFRTTKNPDVSTGSLACPFAHFRALLTNLLAPHCSFCPMVSLRSFVCSLACLLTDSLPSLRKSG